MPTHSQAAAEGVALQSPAGGSPAPDSDYEGYVDVVRWSPWRTSVVGWVRRRGAPAERVSGSIVLGSAVMANFTADRHRLDLVNSGIGDGGYGFLAEIDSPLSPEDAVRLRIATGPGCEPLAQATVHIEPLPMIKGAIDTIGSHTVAGWVFDPNRPDKAVTVELWVDDAFICTVTGDHQRDDLEAVQPKAGRYGFELSLDALARPSGPLDLAATLDGNQHRFSLRWRNAEIYATTVTTRPRLLGKLEQFSKGHLQGWFVNQLRPGSPVDITITVDGRELIRTRTSESREDLAKSGLKGGAAGLSLPVPVSPTGRPDFVIDAVYTKTGESIGPSVAAANQPLSLANTWGSGVARAATAEPVPVSVIVPIFNAYDEVRECLNSLIGHTTWPCRLILIDDASTDDRMAKLLDTIEGYPGVTIRRNAENLGFTRTVNLGLSLAGGSDVVLLNSDTVVTPRWLENLRLAAYAQSDVGTVTPLSNNAGAFSVPEPGIANVTPSWLSGERYARAVSQSSAGLYCTAPTGNGFCLFVRRAMLDDVGLLDETAFPRGYGEENDLCMRALRRGWRHVIDDRTIIYHARSASFGAEKETLYRDGRQVIDQRYPEYGALVRLFGASPDLAIARYRVRQIDEFWPKAEGLPRPRAMFVISTDTGGTPQTNMDLMQALAAEYDCLLLRCDSHTLSISRIVNGQTVLLETRSLAKPLEPVSHRAEEYDHIVAGWLTRYAVELLHIRHIGWHSLQLPRIARGLGIPVVFSFHDFYTVCPTVKLLDDKSAFCGGVCTEGKGTCNPELWPRSTVPHLKHAWVHTWRASMGAMLRECDAFVTTTLSARDLLIANFPWLAERDFRVIPHGRDFSGFSVLAAPLQCGERLRVLVPGNIGPAKGSDLIARIRQLDPNTEVEFHFLGTVSAEVARCGVNHGPYRRDEFAARVAAIRPHVGAVLSIWPETYSHTLTEMWACGVPVVGIDLGAIGERISQSKGGWLISSTDPADILARLLGIAADPEEHWRVVTEVLAWQRGTGVAYGTAAMAERYSDLYRDARGRRRVFVPASRPAPAIKTFGLLSLHQPPQRPPDSLRWFVEWLRYPDADTVRTRTVSLAELAAGGSAQHLDALVLSDGNVPATAAAAIDRFLAVSRIPLVLSRDGRLTVRRFIAGGGQAPGAEKSSSWAEEPLGGDAALRYAIDETLWLRPARPASGHPPTLPAANPRRKTLLLAPDWDSTDSVEAFEALWAELSARDDVTPVALGSGKAPERPGLATIRFPGRPEDIDLFKKAIGDIAAGWCLAVYLPSALPSSGDASADRLAKIMARVSLLGIPPLAPRRQPFTSLIQNEVTGFLTDLTVDAILGEIQEALSGSVDVRTVKTRSQAFIMDRLTSKRLKQSFRALVENLTF